MGVAEIIFKQLGGMKFMVMTGAKNLLSHNKENALSMKLPRNKSKANYLKITLNSSDTYDMVFSKYKTNGVDFPELIEVERHEGIYNDMLQEIFTKVTGMYTKL